MATAGWTGLAQLPRRPSVQNLVGGARGACSTICVTAWRPGCSRTTARKRR